MSDRELLESLGYRVVNSPQGTSRRPCWCVQHPDSRLTGCHETEARAEHNLQFIMLTPHFWLEMDDALAKRGWDTTRINCGSGPNAGLILYSAAKGLDLFSSVESSDNRACREVYESIIAKEGREEG